MAADFTIKQDDTAPDLTATLRDANGPVDLTGAVSVAFHLASSATGVVKVNAPGDFVARATGDVSYTWQVDDTDTAGLFEGEFEVTWGDSTIETFPNTGPIWIQITPEVA